MIQRHQIEGHAAEEIAATVKQLFDEYCKGQGPSVPAEKFEEIYYTKTCGSKIPKFEE